MKYVDNINVMLDIIPLGWRWSSGSLEWREEWEYEVRETDTMDESRTMEIVRQTAESIVEWL